MIPLLSQQGFKDQLELTMADAKMFYQSDSAEGHALRPRMYLRVDSDGQIINHLAVFQNQFVSQADMLDNVSRIGYEYGRSKIRVVAAFVIGQVTFPNTQPFLPDRGGLMVSGLTIDRLHGTLLDEMTERQSRIYFQRIEIQSMPPNLGLLHLYRTMAAGYVESIARLN